MNIRRLESSSIHCLELKAAKETRQRLHSSLHDSHLDLCQRLLNCVGPTSYIRPHRHSLDPKVETLIAIKGRFSVILFDDTGKAIDVTVVGTEAFASCEAWVVGVEILPTSWHTVIALDEYSTLFETKAGPFIPGLAKEYASWAPGEGEPEAAAYQQSLRRIAERLVRS